MVDMEKDNTNVGQEQTSDAVCVVCCEPLRFVSVGPCNHPICCSLCSLKLRIIEKDNNCVYCKQSQDRVFFTSDRSKRYESFQTWGDVAGPGLIYDAEGEAFFEEANEGKLHHKEIMSLREFRCGLPGCPKTKPGNAFSNRKKLEDHLRKDHDLYLCNLCWEFRRLFPMEQKRYGAKSLQTHIEKGNPKEGMRGHPLCKFCKKRHYNDDTLYEHLNKDHEACHICRSQGKRDDYYRDRKALFKHFRKYHYICDEARCVEEFKVFRNETDLQIHNIQEHPEKQVDRSIKVAFTVKRKGLDGTGMDDNTNSPTNENDEGNFQLDSFSFAYRPGEVQTTIGSTSTSLGASATGGGVPSGEYNAYPDEAAGSTGAATSRWAQAAGVINMGNALRSESEFPELSGGHNTANYQRHGHYQSSHSNFASAVGGGYGDLKVYHTRRYEEERKRGNKNKRRGKRKNLLISNDRSMLTPASRQEQEQMMIAQSAVLRPAPSPFISTASSSNGSDGENVARLVRGALDHDEQKYKEFQIFCGFFGRREINAMDFYSGVSALFDSESKQAKFAHLFPALLDSLPDKALANELKKVREEKEYERKYMEAHHGVKNVHVTGQNDLLTKSKWGAPKSSNSAAQPKAHVPVHSRVKVTTEDFPALNGSTNAVSSDAKNITSAAKRFDDWAKKNPPSKLKTKGIVYLNPASKNNAKAAKKAAAKKKAKKKTQTSILEQF
mmetsp:Transcript_7399/g.9697  ORF Transcript_7399/g.9697 Transcript_7399/m.9697 type:complete len:722 (-) Transcript_7399:993-3158(-)